MKRLCVCLVLPLCAVAQTPSPSPSATATPHVSPSPSPTPVPTLRETVNTLDAAQMQRAIEVLQANFLAPGTLDEISRQRALLEGLIRRLSPGVAIATGSESPPSVPVPFLAEILDDRAGYVRPGALDSAALSQFDAALKSFSDKRLPAVILDLRSLSAGGEFDLAAEFGKRLIPRGKVLFTIQKPSAKQERILTSDRDPDFAGLVVVLVNNQTSGAAEALASTLRLNARAMIVGSDTAGEAVEFSTFPIGGGRSVRVAVSQAVMPDGSLIFPGGVKPDIAVSLPAGVYEQIVAASREKGVSQFVFESERPRLNEAALVANTNPELTSDSQRPERAKQIPRDTVLQRAMDLVTAIGFFEKRN